MTQQSTASQNQKRKLWIIIASVIVVVAALAIYKYIHKQNQDDVLTIGINTPTAKTMGIAVEEAKKQGINVKLVEFSDWNTPNITLEHGDIDANYFQHRPYLDNTTKERGYKFRIAGEGSSTHVGLYSKKYKSLNDLPQNAKAVVPNDPVNQGRALLLFQQAKLITLKDPDNYLSSLKDIQSNPKNLQFIEVEGPQTARALSDADVAFGYPNYLILAKNHDPHDALIFDPATGNRYALLFITRDNYVDKNQKLEKFIHIFQTSAKVRASIDEDSGHDLWYASWK
ncbi:methionine transporter [Acinetobacter sp. 194]|uniref:MetQ/NlpA family ABC transporter substrate-binding protein n=1 Tax=Acinetobacter shaoyimingii TaxID=2715164 RepID=UPI00140BBA23|nr:MetQ/NlpA family ABC transporter substrate-binding protein [Acinetobacter shaoyimingii]NHB57240.1 methionine transporter [Acinetobacter shaoyimingii]